MRSPLTRVQEESGSALVLMAFAMFALIGLTGLAIDVGRLFATRAELSRTADAAALAGIQSFPDVSAGISKAQAFGLTNDPGATIVASQVGTEKKLQVTASKSVPMMFMQLFGYTSRTVTGTAVAGFGGLLDVVIVLDSTYSMASGTKLPDAKTAAHTLVDQLLPDPSGQTVVGLAPFRMCYDKDSTASNIGGGTCTPWTGNQDNMEQWFGLHSVVPGNQVQAFTTSQSTIDNTINQMTADGGTNVCAGLDKARSIMSGPNSHAGTQVSRYVVLLSDGDNNPHGHSFLRGNPRTPANDAKYAGFPSACDPGGDNVDLGTSCGTTETEEGQLDTLTYNLAQTMKSQGIEIYVVGFGVCGTADTATCNTSLIGTGSDSKQDRNLLRCIASSAAGTNDHYVEAGSSSQLNLLFQSIGAAITTRLIQ